MTTAPRYRKIGTGDESLTPRSGRHMATLGICATMTSDGIQPAELARWVEASGFESLWFGEHTHSPDPKRELSGRDPEGYDQLYDPFACIAAAAVATSSLKLGTSVALLPQHHPIPLAKTVATLDRLSNGRLQFGIGAGSRAQEVEDFGFRFPDRWKITREFVHAMRTIWTEELAEFHGEFVEFGPMRSWPKPLQRQGPPILEGAFSPWTAKRIAEYADGWIGWDGVDDNALLAIIENIRAEWRAAGRSHRGPALSIVARLDEHATHTQERLRFLTDAGCQRVILLMKPGEPELQWQQLAWFDEIRRCCFG
jgi:probable F420-dependent oxidoreductase